MLQKRERIFMVETWRAGALFIVIIATVVILRGRVHYSNGNLPLKLAVMSSQVKILPTFKIVLSKCQGLSQKLSKYVVFLHY